MFLTRLISGVILVGAALLTIILSGWVLFFTLLGLSLIGCFELYRALKIKGQRFLGPLDTVGYIGVVLYYVTLILPVPYDLRMLALVAALIMIMFVYVFSYPKYRAFQVIGTLFGIIYVGVMLSYIFLTRELPGGQYHVWLIFLSAWGCDTCAYCVGMLIGKHKMSPKLSPKKSIEGAVGGVIGAALLGVIFAAIFRTSIPVYAIICACGALISMVGDLAASAIKRNMDIKDYGKLIPGHGGVLDRFDSIIFTAPIIYYLTLFLL